MPYVNGLDRNNEEFECEREAYDSIDYKAFYDDFFGEDHDEDDESVADWGD